MSWFVVGGFITYTLVVVGVVWRLLVVTKDDGCLVCDGRPKGSGACSFCGRER